MVISKSTETNRPHRIFSRYISEKYLKFQEACSTIKNVIQVQSRRIRPSPPRYRWVEAQKVSKCNRAFWNKKLLINTVQLFNQPNPTLLQEMETRRQCLKEALWLALFLQLDIKSTLYQGATCNQLWQQRPVTKALANLKITAQYSRKLCLENIAQQNQSNLEILAQKDQLKMKISPPKNELYHHFHMVSRHYVQMSFKISLDR